ncbi:unnamed protein product [Rhizoctonia solani]|uniref:HNH nuclease domain-containing protein n=1 Tax=Rhizoctonia solani TaxID=456999 RepID=A0A8H3B4N0_9AGAM|nr:unnamed protein product [Rhizoctonia solani]
MPAESEALANATTPLMNPASSDADEIIDSAPQSQLLSESGWRSAISVSNRSVSRAQYQGLDEVSHLGHRCVLTGETRSVQMAHLIPKATKLREIQQLQYAFGRKLDLNCRWFNFYLRADWHDSFDNDPCSWALLPEPATIAQIARKIALEKNRRTQNNYHGPWPDFRHPDWFPTTASGYTYHFLPLMLAECKPPIEIGRRRDANTPEAGDLYDHYLPPYTNFPSLKLHVHPYAVIMNAGPKLSRYNGRFERPLPAPFTDKFFEIQYIYEILKNAHESANPSEPSGPSRAPSHDTQPSSASSGPRRSERFQNHSGGAPFPNSNRSSTSSNPQSAAPGGYADIFDVLDADMEQARDYCDLTPCESLSVSTSARSNDLSSKAPNRGKLFLHDGRVKFGGKGTALWVVDVESARSQGMLLQPEDDLSPKTVRYAAEPARPPPTLDWHHWASKYALWWAMIPEYSKCGALSCNDWVQIHDLPSLTRRVDDTEKR